MKLPRNISGGDLSKALTVLGYRFTRQRGSHMRYTTELSGQHHVAIPAHNPLRVGTFHGILKDVAAHHGLTVEELMERLDL